MDQLSWQAPSPSLSLVKGDVHLWRWPIPPRAGSLSFFEILSKDEQDRARRFRFSKHQQNFSFCRGALRKILSGYLGEAPESLEFFEGPMGKPGVRGLGFNLSHSGPQGLLAVVGTGEVGVDHELIDLSRSWEPLARRYFSEPEYEFIQSFVSNERPSAFHQVWALKEALIKASGKGLAHELKNFSVSWGHDSSEVQVHGLALSEDSPKWVLRRLSVFPGAASALAYSQAIEQIHGFDFVP